MLKIAVCDDSRELLEKVEKDLHEYESVRSTPVTVHTYTNAVDLLDGLKKTDYDILILDIIMPGFTGMQAAHEIRKFNEEIKIIFLTSSKEFAIESYSVGAYYYLLKPVLNEKLFSVLDKVVSEITSKQESCVIYTHMGIVNIPFAKIECIEVYNKHLDFHLSDGSTKETRGALTDYENVFFRKKGISEDSPLLYTQHGLYPFNRSRRNYHIQREDLPGLQTAGQGYQGALHELYVYERGLK